MIKTVMAVCLLFLLEACSAITPESTHIAYGTITAVQHRQVISSQPNLAGAAIGGVAGGVVGNQFGKGNGKTAMTVLGAVGGALAGSQVHKTETMSEVTDLTVRLQHGAVFTVTTQPQGFYPGQKVKIIQQGRQASIEAVQ